MHAVVAAAPFDASARHQEVKMGQAFADGEEKLVIVQLAFEQASQNIDSSAGLSASDQGVVETVVMMMGQLIEACLKAGKGCVVTGQDEHLGGQSAKEFQTVEVATQGIGLWLLGPNADIGADAG